MKHLLTVAGSDSSGGAGIQADLKTFAALGTYGMSCICAVTAQNTCGVSQVINIPVPMIRSQMEAVYEDIPPDGVKTGMLSSPEIVLAAAEFLRKHNAAPLVVDPVMVATTGAVLLEQEAVSCMREALIPLADIVTPNLSEAEILWGQPVRSEKDMEKAAEGILGLGCRAVLVKGGHLTDCADDVLFDGDHVCWFRSPKIRTRNTHGTGCTLSSALAVMMADGLSAAEAVKKAKKYMEGAIRSGKEQKTGHGNGPVHHFWFYKDWGQMP